MSDSSSDEGGTIHEAAYRGDLEAVRRFVEDQGTDPDWNNGLFGVTPLINAVRSEAPSALSVIRYLLSKNVDIEATYEGETPLMMACRDYSYRPLRAAYNRHCRECGSTALSEATENCGHCIVATLLQHGANPNPPLTRGCNSALYNACTSGDIVLVQQLLACGADADLTNGEWAAPLNAAAGHYASLVRLLLENGANVDTTQTSWSRLETPLLIAARMGNLSMLQSCLNTVQRLIFVLALAPLFSIITASTIRKPMRSF